MRIKKTDDLRNSPWWVPWAIGFCNRVAEQEGRQPRPEDVRRLLERCEERQRTTGRSFVGFTIERGFPAGKWKPGFLEKIVDRYLSGDGLIPVEITPKDLARIRWERILVCTNCGKLYWLSWSGTPYCPDCREAENALNYRRRQQRLPVYKVKQRFLEAIRKLEPERAAAWEELFASADDENKRRLVVEAETEVKGRLKLKEYRPADITKANRLKKSPS